jgi:long-subunit acyl-CoA synthetase (AMP-forming)
MGLAPGGHLGVLAENRVEWLLAQMGAGLVGAVTVGVYPTSPSNEVAYVVGHADIEVIVCEDQEQTDKVLEAIDAAAAPAQDRRHRDQGPGDAIHAPKCAGLIGLPEVVRPALKCRHATAPR